MHSCNCSFVILPPENKKVCASKAAHTKNVRLLFATTQKLFSTLTRRYAKNEAYIFFKKQTPSMCANIKFLCGNIILQHFFLKVNYILESYYEKTSITQGYRREEFKCDIFIERFILKKCKHRI